MEGYWVRTSVKVEITKEEKRKIGRHSSPRWELDIVAYSGRDNVLRVVECKSYLDSRGVLLRGFDGSCSKTAERYKLFADSVQTHPLRSLPFTHKGHYHAQNSNHQASEAPRLLQHSQDDVLDLADVVGKRLIGTGLKPKITIREENAIAALEVVMSRFASDPKWLI